MEIIQDKNSRSALIGTILIHLLLLLLFLQFGMPYQDPPEENQGGMIINFGTSDDGDGEEQPTEPTSSPSMPSTAEEQVVTQSTTETINMNATEKPKKIVEEAPPTISNDLSKALDALNNVSDNSEGETGKTGDQGDPEGDPNSKQHTGGKNGGGIGYDLGGRGKVSFKKPDNPTQEDGNVVVDIVVDKYGKVIKATPGARGSTTANPILYKVVREAALMARFTPKIDAFDQKGTMTFVFILN